MLPNGSFNQMDPGGELFPELNTGVWSTIASEAQENAFIRLTIM